MIYVENDTNEGFVPGLPPQKKPHISAYDLRRAGDYLKRIVELLQENPTGLKATEIQNLMMGSPTNLPKVSIYKMLYYLMDNGKVMFVQAVRTTASKRGTNPKIWRLVEKEG